MPADRAAPASAPHTVAAARASMLAAAAPLPPEPVALAAAAGRTLATTLVAPRAQPPFPSSAMDGYGVRSADLALGHFTVRGEAAAGRAYSGPPLGPADAVRIFTGAPVPDGIDVVVPQERTARAGQALSIQAPLPGRSNIRAAGCDFRAGDVLVRRGTRLQPGHVALIAAAGIASVSVTRRPRIAVLATGNEIVPPGAHAAPHQIFDSVSFGLGALIELWGGSALTGGAPPDDRAAIAAAVTAALAGADVVVIVGGASVGDYDLVKESLAGLGLALAVPRIAIRPGKPTWFGTLGAKPVLGLPGNPAAALVCAQLFLRPLVHALLARSADAPAPAALLDGELPDCGANETYLRARVQSDAQGCLRVLACADQDTSLLSVFAAANALIRRPAGAGPAGRGELVEVLMLDQG